MAGIDPASDRRWRAAALGGLSLLVRGDDRVARVRAPAAGVYEPAPGTSSSRGCRSSLALLVYDGVRRGAGRVPLFVLGGLWLLFFPNAPYLVTDLKYVGWYDEAPLWYDVALLIDRRVWRVWRSASPRST